MRENPHHLIICTNPIWNSRYNSEGHNRAGFGCAIAAEQLQCKRIITSSLSNEALDKILLSLNSFKFYQNQDWAKQTIITSFTTHGFIWFAMDICRGTFNYSTDNKVLCIVPESKYQRTHNKNWGKLTRKYCLLIYLPWYVLSLLYVAANQASTN